MSYSLSVSSEMTFMLECRCIIIHNFSYDNDKIVSPAVLQVLHNLALAYSRCKRNDVSPGRDRLIQWGLEELFGVQNFGNRSFRKSRCETSTGFKFDDSILRKGTAWLIERF